MTSVIQKNSLKSFLKKLVTQYSYWLSFFMLLILAVAVNTSFLRWSNISNIFVQTATTGIIALGMTMIISAGQIDISVGAQVAIISGLGIVVLNRTNNILIMFLFCMGLGFIIGLCNGLLVSKGRMPAMIATLATQSICRSLINQLGQGGPFTVSDVNYGSFRKVAAGYVPLGNFRIPYPMLMFIGFSLLFGLIMSRTKLGKHIYAVGSNQTSARLAGVNVEKVQNLVFIITGLLCGFSGWLYASRVMAVAAASAGNGYEMEVIASVAIGGTAMTGGRGQVIGTFLGALMFKIINNILTMANVPTFLNGAISGLIIIVAVLMQNVQNKSK
ncbi:MAG TPA: ABC transporter permease [Flexilinea sp.]|nr:ABC transporter permease [Flexilinea sp.]